jgi:hypothetical protein
MSLRRLGRKPAILFGPWTPHSGYAPQGARPRVETEWGQHAPGPSYIGTVGTVSNLNGFHVQPAQASRRNDSLSHINVALPRHAATEAVVASGRQWARTRQLSILHKRLLSSCSPPDTT